MIIRGFRLAKQKALEIANSCGESVDINDGKTLEKIALTAMTGKGSEAAKESLAKIVDSDTGVFNSGYFTRHRLRDYVFQNGGVPITYAIIRAGENLLTVKDYLKQRGIIEIGLGAPGDLLVAVSSSQNCPLRAIAEYPVALSAMEPPARGSVLHEKAVRELVRQCGEKSCAYYFAAMPSRSA